MGAAKPHILYLVFFVAPKGVPSLAHLQGCIGLLAKICAQSPSHDTSPHKGVFQTKEPRFQESHPRHYRLAILYFIVIGAISQENYVRQPTKGLGGWKGWALFRIYLMLAIPFWLYKKTPSPPRILLHAMPWKVCFWRGTGKIVCW